MNNRSTRLIWAGFWGWFLACTIFGPPQIAAQETESDQRRNDDALLIDGLRRRRLFDLAQTYCRDQLNSSELDATRHAMLVVELMKTLTSKAILSPADQRAANWIAVEKAALDFARSNPEHPRRFLVEVQLALSHLAHGRLLRQEISAEMASNDAREAALHELRTARDQLNQLQREIDRVIPEQRAKSLGDHDLTVRQMMTLNNNIRFQLAVGDLNRAQLYDVNDRLNRIDALNNVSGRLSEVQRETSEGQPLWWKTKLAQLECLRLLGKYREARELWETLPSDGIPGATLDSLLEQQIRLAIEIGDASLSRSLLAEVDKLPTPSAQLDLAVIELAVDLAARASSDAKKSEWINFGSQAAIAIEKKHGGYWGRRADLVLIEGAGGIPNTTPLVKDPIKMASPTTANNTTITNTEMKQLVRLAEAAARDERWDDAIKAYDFAAAKARTLGAAAQALGLDIRVSQILEKQGKPELAATRLIESAKQHQESKVASPAHLRGCWNFAQTISNDNPGQKQMLQAHLTDHLATWPTQTSSNQARLWLGGQYQSEEKWQLAFDTFLQVAFDSPFLESALEQATQCAKRMLAAIRQSGKSPQPETARLLSRLLEKQSQLDNSDPVAMQLELDRAELDLLFGTSWPKEGLAETLVAIESSDEIVLANRAVAIHAVTICVDDLPMAKQLLRRLDADQDSLDLAGRCLSAIAEHSGQMRGLSNTSELRLLASDLALNRLQTEQPDDQAQRTRWLSRKSQALSALNRHGEAVETLQELEKAYPNDAQIQMQLARAMTAQYRSQSPEKPLARWRRIAARLKSGTPNWYEAKYMVASLLLESGKKTEAAKLLKYIQVIPGWEQSELKPKFEQLLRSSTSR